MTGISQNPGEATACVLEDPVWTERMRRRRTFADAELERTIPTSPQLGAPSAICRHLLAALIRTYTPLPPPVQKQNKISFSIESIIGAQ